MTARLNATRREAEEDRAFAELLHQVGDRTGRQHISCPSSPNVLRIQLFISGDPSSTAGSPKPVPWTTPRCASASGGRKESTTARTLIAG